ncbi:class I SAM-dependent methyltransferase [Actinomadura sp. NPDC047616]|uniref:class I SAM-dependent methyltransferase n=1 Tax=Actinomadura sp. NPDC047616 TaxID=3155914 RepID=UPI0033CDEBAA
MEGFDPAKSFGYEVSKRYDGFPRGDEEQTVRFLAGLAGGRRALEFAVGTGRIALPLMRAGVPVDGIELSQDMVDRLREKPDGDKIPVTMGDMSRVTTGRTYGLVYLVFNTIGNLLTPSPSPQGASSSSRSGCARPIRQNST